MIKAEIMTTLQEVASTCNEPGWDGHGAEAVDVETVRMAERVIAAKPAALPQPDFGAEPDGEITMEWYNSTSKRCISASINKNGIISWAANNGWAKSGKFLFIGVWPQPLITIILMVLDSIIYT